MGSEKTRRREDEEDTDDNENEDEERNGKEKGRDGKGCSGKKCSGHGGAVGREAARGGVMERCVEPLGGITRRRRHE
jgi:hypothetical protein